MKTENRFGDYRYEPVNKGLEESARANFVSKVYSTLSIQLLVTALTVMLNIFNPTFAYVQETYNSLWWLSFIVVIGTIIALSITSIIFSSSLTYSFSNLPHQHGTSRPLHSWRIVSGFSHLLYVYS